MKISPQENPETAWTTRSLLLLLLLLNLQARSLTLDTYGILVNEFAPKHGGCPKGSATGLPRSWITLTIKQGREGKRVEDESEFG